MYESGVYSRLSAAPFQGSSIVRKQNANNYIIQVGGVASRKDKNHPLSHYLQLRMFHVPTAKWLPHSVVSNGYFNRAYHATVALDDEIFVFGGENVGQRNIYPPLLYFQQAEHEVLKISKGFFGYKTIVVPLETEIPLEQLGLVGHSATVVSYENKQFTVLYGGLYPSLSGKYQFNQSIYIFSIENAAEYHAEKLAASGGVPSENPFSGNPDDKVYVVRSLEVDPSLAIPPSRAFHSAIVLPATTTDPSPNANSSSTRILIHGGKGENIIYDDSWILDISEYLAFLHKEAIERRKAAVEQPAAAAVAAPAGKDAKKDAKKDNKKDVAAPPPKPAYPFVQWKGVAFDEDRDITNDAEADTVTAEEKVSKEEFNRKRWDHTLSVWPILATNNSTNVEKYHVLITGGHGSATLTSQVLETNDVQLHLTLTVDGHGISMKNAVDIRKELTFRLPSWELPALWGSKSETIIPRDVLSRGDGNDESDLSLVLDIESVAVLVLGGFRADEDKMGWPSRPGSPSNINPSGMNHHLFDLSATIAASKTTTTIVSPDLLATASHIRQNPKKTTLLHVAEQDLLDRTYILISSDDNVDDPNLSADNLKRLKQRNLARDYLRRVMRGEDPDRVKADIMEQLRRANMQLAAVTFEDRRIIYPQTGNVYEGQVVPVASLLSAAREAGETEPTFDNEFEGVVPHGKGQMNYAQTGNVYNGDWCFGRAHGNGTYDDANEDIRYTGQFVDDRRQGQGQTVDLNQGKDSRWNHRGEYRDNRFEGPGEFTDVGQGLTYIGNFHRGLKNGHGKIVLSNDRSKLVCEGKWSEDSMVGEGIAYALPIISLNVIKGHLPNNITLNIFFEMSIASALRPPPWLAVKEDRKTLLIAGDYSGKLLDGKPNDEIGTAVYSDGSVCRASWKLGRRNGHGVYVFGPDRTNFEGKWVGDRRCGHGTWKTPANRVIYDGLWLENVYHGTGRLIDYDVDVVYEGQFRLGFKEGQGLVRPRETDDDEMQRIIDSKTKKLAGAPASPLEVLDQSQWIHDHTVLLPPEEQAVKGGVRNEGSMADSTYLSASYPPSPGDGYGSPNAQSSFNSPSVSRAGRR